MRRIRASLSIPTPRAVLIIAPVVIVLLLSGCVRPTPQGVGLKDGMALAVFKPCEEAIVGEVKVYRGDFASGQVVWSARLVDPRQGRLQIPLGSISDSQLLGYDVTDHMTGSLEPNQLYSVSATSERGVNFGGSSFRPSELQDGKLLVDGKLRDLEAWAAEPPECDAATLPAAVRLAILASVLGLAVLLSFIILFRRRKRA